MRFMCGRFGQVRASGRFRLAASFMQSGRTTAYIFSRDKITDLPGKMPVRGFNWQAGLSIYLIAYVHGCRKTLARAVSRSLAYIFPWLLVLFKVCGSTLYRRTTRRIAVLASLVSTIMPTYYLLLDLHPMLPILRLF